jgi:hypothetical protein
MRLLSVTRPTFVWMKNVSNQNKKQNTCLTPVTHLWHVSCFSKHLNKGKWTYQNGYGMRALRVYIHFSKQPFPFWLPNRYIICNSHLSDEYCISGTSKAPRIDQYNNIWGIQGMKLTIMNFSPVPCYFTSPNILISMLFSVPIKLRSTFRRTKLSVNTKQQVKL